MTSFGLFAGDSYVATVAWSCMWTLSGWTVPCSFLLAGASMAGFLMLAFTEHSPSNLPLTGVRLLTWRNKIIPLYEAEKVCKVGKLWGLNAHWKSALFIDSFALSSKESDSFSYPIFSGCFKFCMMSSTLFPGHFNDYSLHSVELMGTFN